MGRTLGVRYVLEGSVRKAGQRVRVNAQMIDATTGGHVWAERFDRDLTDIFAVQDELTREIVAALEVRLTTGEKKRLSQKREVDVEAYELFLRGREQTWLHTPDGNVTARALFERAIHRAPDYAAAHAGVGFTHVTDYVNAWTRDPQESLDTGLEIAERAVTMDEQDAHARCCLAVALIWKRELNRALNEARHCLTLAPSFAAGHLALAHAQIFSGDGAAALLLRPSRPSRREPGGLEEDAEARSGLFPGTSPAGPTLPRSKGLRAPGRRSA